MTAFDSAYNLFRRRRTRAPDALPLNFGTPAARSDLGNCADCLAAHPTKDLRGSPPLCKPCRRIRRDR